eukprot:Polyplicarium_translucidae@DN3973_c0_g1_i1.p4
MTYTVAGGVRSVLPYRHRYEAAVKRRWVGKALLDAMTAEFAAYPPEYYEAAIERGDILVDSALSSGAHTLRAEQRITHDVDRSEPPIVDRPIGILAASADVVAVEKPPGINVHSGGGYRFNTLVEILRTDDRYRSMLQGRL